MSLTRLSSALPLERILCHPLRIPFGARMKAELPSLAETGSVCDPLGGCTRRLLLAILRGCSSRWLRGSPTSRPAGRPRWDRWLAGPAPVPAGGAIAEGFAHLPNGRRFSFCKSAQQCNFGLLASAACRYSVISSGKMVLTTSLLPSRVPVSASQPLLTAILG